MIDYGIFINFKNRSILIQSRLNYFRRRIPVKLMYLTNTKRFSLKWRRFIIMSIISQMKEPSKDTQRTPTRCRVCQTRPNSISYKEYKNNLPLLHHWIVNLMNQFKYGDLNIIPTLYKINTFLHYNKLKIHREEGIR